MTAMPQLVSLFNAVGGGAAALLAINDIHSTGIGPLEPDLDHPALDLVIGAGHLLRIPDRRR